MAPSAHRSTQQGFTLIEVLVTFILFGLIVVLLFSGYGYALMQRERFRGWLDDYHTDALRRGWFEATIEGLANPLEQTLPDTATSDRFAGVSASLPGTPPGQPRAFELIVEAGSEYRLLLVADDREWTLVTTREPLRLAYLDYDGNTLASWPPQAEFGTPLPLLPLAVVLREGEAIRWLKRPGGRVGQFVSGGQR
ncbi:MAG: prepilin-type N-terminal cleavage/methylation domain-containing protein [Pseudomonadota bacterium]